MTAKEIAQAAGVSAATVYNRAKQLGRFPTVEEVKNTRNGRPAKYGELESMSGHPIDIPGHPASGSKIINIIAYRDSHKELFQKLESIRDELMKEIDAGDLPLNPLHAYYLGLLKMEEAILKDTK